MNIHLLNKFSDNNIEKIDIYPISVIKAIFDEDGNRLDSILSKHNSILLLFAGTKEDTRLTVPAKLRKLGLIVTYIDLSNNIITETYSNTDIEDDTWKDDTNWKNNSSSIDLSNYITVLQLNLALLDKLDTLVSGTNIKTINNQSILGSGNINIDAEPYIIDYLDTNRGTITEQQYNDLRNAINNHKCILAIINDVIAIVTYIEYNETDIYIILSDSFNVLIFDIKNNYSYTVQSKDILYKPNNPQNGYVITFNNDVIEWKPVPEELPQDGTVGQVLTKTDNGVAWQTVQSGDNYPSGGTAGQVLKKTNDGVEWSADNDTTYAKATLQADGLMSKEDKAKLDNIQNGANNYTLPIASSDTLGGVKVGAGLSINQETGVLSTTGGGVADSVDWDNITSKPSTFTPSEHTHTVSDIKDFPTFKTVNGEAITGEGDIEINLNTPTAEATSIDSTSDPVVNVTDLNGTWNFSFQIPKGLQGEQGPAGPQGPQGEQGPAGADGQDGQDGSDAVSYVILPNTNVIKNLYIKNITVTTNMIRHGAVGPDTRGLYIEYSTEGGENKSITIEDRKNNVTEVSFTESDVTKVTIYLTLSSTGVSSSSEKLACATVTSVFDGKNAEPSEDNFVCKIFPSETIIYGLESTTVVLDTLKVFDNTTSPFTGALRIVYYNTNGEYTEESITGRAHNNLIITIPSNIRAVYCSLYYEDRTESANIADTVFIYRVNPLNSTNSLIITQSEYNQLLNKDSNTIYFIKG